MAKAEPAPGEARGSPPSRPAGVNKVAPRAAHSPRAAAPRPLSPREPDRVGPGPRRGPGDGGGGGGPTPVRARAASSGGAVSAAPEVLGAARHFRPGVAQRSRGSWQALAMVPLCGPGSAPRLERASHPNPRSRGASDGPYRPPFGGSRRRGVDGGLAPCRRGFAARVSSFPCTGRDWILLASLHSFLKQCRKCHRDFQDLPGPAGKCYGERLAGAPAWSGRCLGAARPNKPVDHPGRFHRSTSRARADVQDLLSPVGSHRSTSCVYSRLSDSRFLTFPVP